MPHVTRQNRADGLRGRFLCQRILLLWAALLAGAVLMAAPASAQVAPGTGSTSQAADSGASDAEIDALVRKLEDPDQRAALIEQLELLKSAQDEAKPADDAQPLIADGLGALVLSALSEQIERMSRGFAAVGAVILQLPDAVADLVRQAQEPENRQRWMEILGKLALVLGAALVAKWLADRLLARPRRMIESRHADSLWVKIPMLVLRLLLELLPIAAFAAAAYAVLPMTEPRPATRLVALVIINASVIVRTVRAVALVLLAPSTPHHRLPRLTDESAHYCYIWISRITAVAVYGYFIAQAALLLGLPPSAYGFLLRAVGLLVAGMMVVLILQNRASVAEWMRGRPAQPGVEPPPGRPAGRLAGFGVLRHRVADVWHVLAIVYVVASYVIWALDVPGGFEFLLRATILSAIVLALLRLALMALRRIVRRGFALSTDLKRRFPGLEARSNRYLPAFERLLQVVLYIAATLWLLEIWGVDSFGWLASDFGQRLTGSIVTIAIIIIVSAVLLEIMDVVIERYLAPKDAYGRPVMRSARVRTLLPLLRNALRILLAVMVTLIVLSELGINIAPLLAGAGVVGLAIGFGAQTLVKDVITGFFILAEDTLSVGDVADIDGNAGVVEAMTIRTIRLRDVAGTVYTIPFSAVTTIKNLTKDFSFAKFDVGVAYDSDTDEVIELMRDVAKEMRQDPEFRYMILDDLEVMGLNQFGDSALMLLARLRTPPGKQWSVSREFNRRLKMLFDKHGVEFPFPQRTIHMINETPKREKSRGKESGDPAEPVDADQDGGSGTDGGMS